MVPVAFAGRERVARAAAVRGPDREAGGLPPVARRGRRRRRRAPPSLFAARSRTRRRPCRPPRRPAGRDGGRRPHAGSGAPGRRRRSSTTTAAASSSAAPAPQQPAGRDAAAVVGRGRRRARLRPSAGDLDRPGTCAAAVVEAVEHLVAPDAAGREDDLGAVDAGLAGRLRRRTPRRVSPDSIRTRGASPSTGVRPCCSTVMSTVHGCAGARRPRASSSARRWRSRRRGRRAPPRGRARWRGA